MISEDNEAAGHAGRWLAFNFKMAAKVGPSTRAEIQEAIKAQGEIIRNLKLVEQTDEVKNKVSGWCLLPFFGRFRKFLVVTRGVAMRTNMKSRYSPTRNSSRSSYFHYVVVSV